MRLIKYYFYKFTDRESIAQEYSDEEDHIEIQTSEDEEFSEIEDEDIFLFT